MAGKKTIAFLLILLTLIISTSVFVISKQIGEPVKEKDVRFERGMIVNEDSGTACFGCAEDYLLVEEVDMSVRALIDAPNYPDCIIEPIIVFSDDKDKKIKIKDLKKPKKDKLDFKTTIKKEKKNYKYDHKMNDDEVIGFYYNVPEDATFDGKKLKCNGFIFDFTQTIDEQGFNISFNTTTNELKLEGDYSYIDPDITFDSSQTVCGLYEYTNIVINNSATISVCDYNGDGLNGTVEFRSTTFFMDTGTTIDGMGRGYTGGSKGNTFLSSCTQASGSDGLGIGNGTGGEARQDGIWSTAGGGAGAGYGGTGGDSEAGQCGGGRSGDITYGDTDNVTQMGSGGGGGITYADADMIDAVGQRLASDGGDGGGYIKINTTITANISGTINFNGNSSLECQSGTGKGGGGGGGSGGGIWLHIGTLQGTGTISADGGDGAYANVNGGGGGGGRVFIEYCLNSSSLTVSTAKGIGGKYSAPDASDGVAGTINYTERSNCFMMSSLPSIAPTTAYNNDSLNCSVTFFNSEGVTNGQFRWYNNTVLDSRFDNNVSCTSETACYSSIGVGYLNTTQLDNWTCSVEGNYSGTILDWTNVTRLISNYVPTTSNPTITPANPRNFHPLTCTNSSIVDVDVDEGDDTITLTWDWYNSSDGVSYVSTGFNSNTLGKRNLTNGTYWKCLFSASDGHATTVNYTSSAVWINYSMSSPSIAPTTAYNNDTLNCSVTFSSDDGNVNGQFRWYNNSVLVPSLDYNTSCVSDTVCYSTIGYLNTSQFDNWTCSVGGNVSIYTLDFFNSSGRLISNSIPTSSNPTINSTDLTSYYDLTCVNSTIYDADVAEGDDTITLTWDWYSSSDDVSYVSSGVNNNVLGSGNLSDGDYWKCLFYATDGLATTANYTSAVSYINQTITSVSISPTTAYNNDTLNCTVTFQYFGSAINGQFRWYNNSVLQPQFDSNTSCTSGTACYSTLGVGYLNTSQFDNWTCSVAGNSSGIDIAWVNSSVRFINNTLTTSTNPTISPGAPDTSDNLICVNNSIDDIDVDEGDDTLTITWDWYNSSDGVTYLSTGINNNNLSAGNLSTGAYWKCLFYVNDGHYTTANYTSGPVVVSAVPQNAPYLDSGNSSYLGVITSADNPANNNTYVDFQYNFSDVEGDSGKLYVCSTDSFSVAGGCTVTEYCNSGTNYSVGAINCTVSDLNVFTNSITTVYAFINSSVYSLYSNSLSCDVHVNHFPEGTPTIASANNGTEYGSGQSTVPINWSALTDDDSDTINYTVYYGVDKSPDAILVNDIVTGYLWSVSPNHDYYWKVETVDEHGYLAPVNSSVYTFNVDAESVSPPNPPSSSGVPDLSSKNITEDILEALPDFCGDGYCSAKESLFNCPQDCAPIFGDVSIDALLCTKDRCIWKEAGFTTTMFLFVLLGLLYIPLRKYLKKKKFGKVKRWLRR